MKKLTSLLLAICLFALMTPCGAVSADTVRIGIAQYANHPSLDNCREGFLEGLAMGAFATFYTYGRDPLMVKLMQLVMTDEAFHHKFGKIWADRTIPHLSETERNLIEDWAAQVFQGLLFNLGSPEQKKSIYAEFGLDWQWVQGAVAEAFTTPRIRERLKDSTSIFRVLIKTLLKAGIITDRTRHVYAAFVDMAELHTESDRMIGDDIAEKGIQYLQQINGAHGFGAGLLAAE